MTPFEIEEGSGETGVTEDDDVGGGVEILLNELSDEERAVRAVFGGLKKGSEN